MSALEDGLLRILVDYGLLAIFLTMTLESACIPIPSEIVVPYGGFLAAQGHVELWQVVVVATVANVVGSGLAYYVGWSGGRTLLLRYGKYVLLSRHHLDAAERWFERRGQITVFVTRMMPGVRTFISLPAGMSRMNLGKFFLYSALGSIPWNLGLALLGYAFGANWERLQDYFHRYNAIFWAALAFAVVAGLAWWYSRRRRASSD